MAEGTELATPMLEAPITAVTVFRDGARVQRSGTVDVAPGRQAVVIGGLPASVDPASVRVAARGPGLTLLNVEVHHGYRTDPLRDETARLRAEAERCRDAVRALDDEDAAVQARLDFLDHLSVAAATALARAVGFGRASHDDLAQMAGHLSADTADALGRRRDIAARSRAARRELEAAERLLAAALRPDAGRRAANGQLPGRGDPADRGGLARRGAGPGHHAARPASGTARTGSLVHREGCSSPGAAADGPGHGPDGRRGRRGRRSRRPAGGRTGRRRDHAGQRGAHGRTG